MKCPNCESRTSVDLDIHSGGFSSNDSPVKECSSCGLVWRVKVKGDKPYIDIIKPAKTPK